MYSRDYRDVFGGCLLIALGLWLGVHSMSNFSIGTLSQMGPGMFPAALGVLLAGLGCVIAIPAWFRAGEPISVDWRQLCFVSLGVFAFSLLLTRVGMVPAILVLTIAAALADTRLGIVGTLLLAVVLAFIAYVIFRLGLGIHIAPFRWQF